MIRYILLVFNIIIFTPLFSILIIVTGFFDRNKQVTSYLAKLWAKIILKLSFVRCNIKGIDKIKSNNKEKLFYANEIINIRLLLR